MSMISRSMGSAALIVLHTDVWEMNDVPRLPCRTLLDPDEVLLDDRAC